MKTLLFKVAFLLIVGSWGSILAQTDYSFRMRSLSIDLSGIADDPLTDVFLNPARLEAFREMEIYGTRLPARTVTIPYPSSSASRYNSGPKETINSTYQYEPLALGFFLPLGNRAVLSLGAEAYMHGEDNALEDTYYRYPSTAGYLDNELVQQTDGFERSDDIMHLLIDLAMARLGKTTFGARLTASYDRDRDNQLSTYNRVSTDFDTQTELAVFNRVSFYFPEFEKTDIGITLGLARPEGRLTDIVLGGGIHQQLQSNFVLDNALEDEDVDGNGRDIGGLAPYQEFYELRINTERDYMGYQIFTRAHWKVYENLRAAHAISWEQSEGDGGTIFRKISERSEGSVYDINREKGKYSYDGATSRFSATTTFGYSAEVYEGFLVIVGVTGRYYCTQFEEDGKGNASLFLDSSSSRYDSLSFSSPYVQRHDTSNESYFLSVPVACEWQPHRFVKIRGGIEFKANHYDNNSEYSRKAVALDLPGGFPASGVDMDYYIAHDTYIRFSNGVEVNIKDRFILELLASASSSLNLAEYGYISVRYRF